MTTGERRSYEVQPRELDRTTRAKPFSVFLLFALAIQSLRYGDVMKLSTEERRVLQESSRLHGVHSTSDLSSAIVALCAGDNRKLADPGPAWQTTDVITAPTVPGKHTVGAATGGESCAVQSGR